MEINRQGIEHMKAIERFVGGMRRRRNGLTSRRRGAAIEG
jgi:hypothetical protein